MHAYKFRLLSDENDEFLRDIEIKSTQTFKDFHNIIKKVAGIDGNELASFFICDRKWNKMKEITLIDMEEDDYESEQEDLDDEEEETEFRMPLSIMEKSVIKDFIDDPHQRILYEYDILNQSSLYIELIKISPTDPKAKYPVCVKSKGTLTAPKSVKEDFVPEDIDESELLKEFEEMLNHDVEGEETDPTFYDPEV
jgi:hypothetical protein